MLSYFIQIIRYALLYIMNFLGFHIKPSLESSENSVQIFVRTNVGEQVLVNLKPSWNVKRIKSDVAQKLSTSPDNLKIIFGGKELPDDLVIEDCDLGSRSVLHAVRIEERTSEDTNLVKLSACDVPRPEVEYAGPNESQKCGLVSADVNKLSLLSDASTVMTIQLSDQEKDELHKIKKANGSGESKQIPHFYVYCIHPCANIRIGKLRVRCSRCKGGAIMLFGDPTNWSHVLEPQKITASCSNPNCREEFAEFYFKCSEHETTGDDDTAVILYLIRSNIPGVPCLACSDVSSPIIVFECSKAHSMCLDCFVTYCISRLNERQFVRDDYFGYTLPCPVGCSNSLIKEIHHFKLMGEQHYERYQRFATEEALLALGGVFCPHPGCGQGILPDEDCRRVKCISGCEYVFCKDCLQGYHLGNCILENSYYAPVSSSFSFTLNPERVALSSWDEATGITIIVTTKPCPKCRTPTERDGGCMHMVCTRAACQFNWCWVCQTEWTRECMAAHWFG